MPFDSTKKTWKMSKALSGPNSVTRDRVARLSLYRTLCGKITVEKVPWPREMRRYGRLRDKVNEVWRFCNATATRCTFVSASIAEYFYIEWICSISMGMYRVPESTEKLNVDYVQTGERRERTPYVYHRCTRQRKPVLYNYRVHRGQAVHRYTRVRTLNKRPASHASDFGLSFSPAISNRSLVSARVSECGGIFRRRVRGRGWRIFTETEIR